MGKVETRTIDLLERLAAGLRKTDEQVTRLRNRGSDTLPPARR